MCGINGHTKTLAQHPGLIEKMNRATAHRGPDGANIFSDESVALGHNLLAITETPLHAQQPWVSDDKKHAMVYNGEIYNYRVLREELEKEGEVFRTQGDTEVIFRGLICHGIDFIKKLDGMFAIAFYVKDSNTLYLFRDRAGMKPLYYGKSGGEFVFSSELRGLFATGVERRLDVDVARSFFLFGYTPGKDTLVQGIQKVLPGYVLTYDLKKGSIKESAFGWNERSKNTLEGTINQMIGDSVNRHTMGLRPFGLFLSGGLDSTIILHELAQRGRTHVKTYTTRFDTKNDLYNQDADLAARLAGDYSIDHHDFLVTEKMFVTHYEDAILAMEEPRYNPSVPAYWMLAQEASKDITIVLNGSGGDELFLGYPRYIHAQSILKKYDRYPQVLLNMFYSLRAAGEGMIPYGTMIDLQTSLDLWAFINKITPLSRNPAFKFLNGYDMQTFLRDAKSMHIPPVDHPLPDKINAVAELDRYFWLANEEFMRTDKIVMHFGLEGRFPFLANDLLSFANDIPSRDKLRRGKKTLLREAYKDKLPDYILTKGKTGWNAPIEEWMEGGFGNMVKEVLSNGYYSPTSGLFDLEYLNKRVAAKTKYSKRDLMEFLPIVQFQVWAKALSIHL